METECKLFVANISVLRGQSPFLIIRYQISESAHAFSLHNNGCEFARSHLRGSSDSVPQTAHCSIRMKEIARHPAPEVAITTSSC